MDCVVVSRVVSRQSKTSADAIAEAVNLGGVLVLAADLFEVLDG